MDTGTCSLRSAFKNGSCSSCPLVLMFYLVVIGIWRVTVLHFSALRHSAPERGAGAPLAGMRPYRRAGGRQNMFHCRVLDSEAAVSVFRAVYRTDSGLAGIRF